eukprot:4255626-Amphidinium_carterae.1
MTALIGNSFIFRAFSSPNCQEGSKEWKAIAAWMNKTIETGHHTDHGRVRLADGKDAETLGMRV